MAVSSRRPYLIRAMFDWAVDNALTPHLVVSDGAAGVEVPPGYANEGKITLNISRSAAQGLVIGNDAIQFSARFGGKPFNVSVPPGAVLAVYAKETGEGIAFGEVETTKTDTDPSPEPPKPGPKKGGRAHLKLVK
jgi:stringent starvation protein B